MKLRFQDANPSVLMLAEKAPTLLGQLELMWQGSVQI